MLLLLCSMVVCLSIFVLDRAKSFCEHRRACVCVDVQAYSILPVPLPTDVAVVKLVVFVLERIVRSNSATSKVALEEVGN